MPAAETPSAAGVLRGRGGDVTRPSLERLPGAIPDRLFRSAARLGSLTVVTTSLLVLDARPYGNGSPTRQPSPAAAGVRRSRRTRPASRHRRCCP